jgi:hypothetical protein
MRKWNESAFSVPPQALMAPMQFWTELFLVEMAFRPSVPAAGSKSPDQMWAEWLFPDAEMDRGMASLIAGVMLHLR